MKVEIGKKYKLSEKGVRESDTGLSESDEVSVDTITDHGFEVSGSDSTNGFGITQDWLNKGYFIEIVEDGA